MSRYRMPFALSLVLIVAVTACKKKAADRTPGVGTTDTLSERDRHEMLSNSGIPGAAGVGAAMRAADATSNGINAAESTQP